MVEELMKLNKKKGKACLLCALIYILCSRIPITKYIIHTIHIFIQTGCDYSNIRMNIRCTELEREQNEPKKAKNIISMAMNQ